MMDENRPHAPTVLDRLLELRETYLQRARLEGALRAELPASVAEYLIGLPPMAATQPETIKNVAERSASDASSPRVSNEATCLEFYETVRAEDLEEPDPNKLWMVEDLWQREGVGILGGPAKSAKTWLALDIAVSVASGTDVLDTFEVKDPGGVLYVSAEGGQAHIKRRLASLCVHRGLLLSDLRLDIIPHAVRIDTPEGIHRLDASVARKGPKLLILDPLIRLHRVDENSAAHVSALLSSLTELQQKYALSVIVVHHMGKRGSQSGEPSGLDFRGSSDLHAWGDSNLFVRRRGPNRFVVSAEHRAAPATSKWPMQVTTDEYPRLEIMLDGDKEPSRDTGGDDQMEKGILELLQRGPQSISDVRSIVKGSNARIGLAVRRLENRGEIVKMGRRWGVPGALSLATARSSGLCPVENGWPRECA